MTSKTTEISTVINETFTNSGTIVNAKGGYTGKDKHIIYFIINRFQINKLKTLVHSIDGNAFISLLDVSDVIHQPDNAKLENSNSTGLIEDTGDNAIS